MEFDINSFMGNAPKSEVTETPTGRKYLTIAKRDGAELKFNVDVAPATALLSGGPTPAAAIVIRIAQNKTESAPDFSFTLRPQQVEPENDGGLYRYLPIVLPLCVLAPTFHLRTKWDKQDVTARLREWFKKLARRNGAVLVVNDDQLDGMIEGWTLSQPWNDPDLFTDLAVLD